ncbi:MAG: hypothetical protein WA432_02870 [Candidatus Babeliaceae bacterium]
MKKGVNIRINKILFLILLIIYMIPSLARIRMLLSAALADAHFEFRKAQYIKSLTLLKDYGYNNVYIVEALKKHGPTFLDDYSKHVFYSTVNNPHLRNNGINEARTLLEGTYYFKFNPEDMIIKLTGRHHFISDSFVQLVKNNFNYDALVKVDAKGDVYTVGFAMRCKYFREMYEQMDYDAMECYRINLEHEVGNYIKRKVQKGNFNVLYVDKLDILANNFGSTTAPGAPENIILF